jgi:putative GTP pyrophosphokinase
MANSIDVSPEQHYDSSLPLLKRLAEEVRFSLDQAVDAAEVKVLSVSTRTKERDSYLEKIVRKGYNDPASEVEDLVGGRVVCYYVSDLATLGQIVDDLFQVLSEDNKVANSPDDTFGYASIHYVCTLKPETSGPRYDGLQAIKFEVQIRTILMDAWANVSHHLAYKGEASVPANLQRDFHALAGLFHIADGQFESLAKAANSQDDAAKAAIAQPSPTFDLPINASTMGAYLNTRFDDREHSSRGSAAEFVQEVSALGFTSIAELDATLSRAWDAAERYEPDHPPTDEDSGEPIKFSAVGIARVALAIAREDYRATKLFVDTSVYADYERYLK